MLLPVTLVVAGVCALIHVWLSVRVSMHRRTHGVSVGDGGNPAMLARIRAHGNFAESAPLFLVLLGGTELAAGSATWLWVAGLLFVAARLIHPFGMDRPAPNPARLIGILLSWLLIVGLGLYALYLVSTTPRVISTSYAVAARAST